MFNSENHCRPTRTRREFIQDAFCGFGSIALAVFNLNAFIYVQ